jgi:hypothetical protein
MNVCEYIYVLDFGHEIFQGSPAEVAESQMVRDAYLGSDNLEPAPKDSRADIPGDQELKAH